MVVHVLLLDASKAFDRVNYCMSFQKLIDKGMCPLVVRLLLHMYTHQKLQVRWNDVISNQSSIVVHCTDFNYGHCGMTVLTRCAYSGVMHCVRYGSYHISLYASHRDLVGITC